MNSTIGIIMKVVLMVWLLLVLIGVYFFGSSYQQAFDFKDYISAQISREGGLTSTAMSNINGYDASQYNGKFTVVSDSGSTKQPYGSIINYHIMARIGGYFFNLPTVPISVQGSAISQVR